jgi:RimJ/RimL family protein N-acetyltransferase
MKTDHEKPAPRQLSNHLVEPLPSGMAPQRAILKGRFVCLEPVDPSVHAEELYDASHRNAEALKIWEFIPHGPWPDQASFERWLRDTVNRLEHVVFAIRSENTGKAAGMVQYHHIEPKSGVVEIGGIWFAPELQRTRGATEVLFLVLSHTMDDLRYRRVQWRCDTHNERSRAAVKRLGFGFEGIFYNESIVKGKNKDTAWYSLLDYEWPGVKEKIMTWLADDNFDDDGLAKTSLSELMTNRAASE